MIKRISAIACSILCSLLVVLPTFSRKTSCCDVVASALELETIQDGLYSIPLPTYNSINEYVGGLNPLPLCAVITNVGFALVRSYDGVTITDADFTDENVVYMAPFVTSGEVSNIPYPFYLQGDGETVVSGKIAIYESSFGLKNFTLEESMHWYPARLTSYYIFPEIQGGVATRDHVYIDFYVDYYNTTSGEYLRGAGFSLRLPFSPEYGWFESDYFHLGDDDVYPVGNYLAFQSDSILGFEYTAYDGIYDIGYDAGRQNGYDEGYSEGHSIGVGEGYDEGYDVGYKAGVEKASTFTFNSLISAVIDVPINAMRSVLNFNILGVDMATFFFSLFTLGVVLTIVRMLL